MMRNTNDAFVRLFARNSKLSHSKLLVIVNKHHINQGWWRLYCWSENFLSLWFQANNYCFVALMICFTIKLWWRKIVIVEIICLIEQQRNKRNDNIDRERRRMQSWAVGFHLRIYALWIYKNATDITKSLLLQSCVNSCNRKVKSSNINQ